MANLLEKQKEEQKVKPPIMWNVVFHNDDFTTFEFVIACLMYFFNKNAEQAFVLTKQVHEAGKAIIGTYPKDLAETKKELALDFAKEQEHPLNITLEQA